MSFTYKQLFILLYLFVPNCFAMPTYIKDVLGWKSPIIDNIFVYEINPLLTTEVPDAQKYIEDALSEFQRLTCVRFRQKTSQDRQVHIEFTKTKRSNSYQTGEIGTRQIVAFCVICTRGVDSYNTVLHEVSHALRFGHEHQRKDRGPYIQVFIVYIPEGSRSQYVVSDRNNLFVPYDYLSVTHYDSDFRYHGIETIDPSFQRWIGKRKNLSFFDVMAVNKLYKCDNRCPEPNRCPPLSFRGTDCQCYCSVIAGFLSDPDDKGDWDWQGRLNFFLRNNFGPPAQVCTPPATTYECDDGWTQSPSHCYIEFNKALKWEQARDHCIAMGARLASPGNLNDNRFINNYVQTKYNVWLNVEYDHTRNAWTMVDTGVEIYPQLTLNSDAWVKPYSNFSVPFPFMNDRIDKTKCIAMAPNGKWHGQICGWGNGQPAVICQKKIPCPKGWFYHSNHCYNYLAHNDYTWQQAIDGCERHGAKLSSSMSHEENRFLTQLRPFANGIWLNAKKGKHGSNVKSWKWFDTDTLFTTNMWAPFQRVDWRNLRGRDPCLMLHRDGWWMGSSCEQKYSAVCKKRPSREPGQHTVVGCQDSLVRIHCDAWGEIKLRSVMYGRADSVTCTDTQELVDQMCNVPDMMTVLGWRCNTFRECSILVNKWFLILNAIIDPCPGVSKYLQVDYDCVQEHIDMFECPNYKPHPKKRFYFERANRDALWFVKDCGEGWEYMACMCLPNSQRAAHATRLTDQLTSTLILGGLCAILRLLI